MKDRQFTDTLNAIARELELSLPVLNESEAPSSEFVADWAGFLESCVREGIELSDPRWRRLTVESNDPQTVFRLEAGEEGLQDQDFRVGLQLLMGLLDREEGESA